MGVRLGPGSLFGKPRCLGCGAKEDLYPVRIPGGALGAMCRDCWKVAKESYNGKLGGSSVPTGNKPRL